MKLSMLVIKKLECYLFVKIEYLGKDLAFYMEHTVFIPEMQKIATIFNPFIHDLPEHKE